MDGGARGRVEIKYITACPPHAIDATPAPDTLVDFHTGADHDENTAKTRARLSGAPADRAIDKVRQTASGPHRSHSFRRSSTPCCDAREQDQLQFRAHFPQIPPDRFGDGLVQRRLDGGPVVHAGHLFLITRRRRAAQCHAAEAFFMAGSAYVEAAAQCAS